MKKNIYKSANTDGLYKLKMKYKRMCATALALSLIFSVCGCGEKDNNTSEKNDDTTTEYVTEAPVYEYEDTETEAEAYDGTYYSEAEMTQNNEMNITDGCPSYYEPEPDIEYNMNEYDNFTENSWRSVANSPLSTFAADVDTAAYTEIRNCIMNGYEVDPSQVRIEEMINYFHYDFDRPKPGEKFGVYTEYADCPWSDDTKLALISINTEAIDFSEAPPSNIVFLIDTSGSMFDDNKLPLVQQALCMLAENLTEKDTISIVTYAGSDEVVLEGVSGDKYYEITSAIEGLTAGGSTNGSAGINTAYSIAEKYFIKGGNNRVILATDGDLNVGITSQGSLEKLIEEKKETGVFLSVLGVGYGNLKDNILETLADKGNGNYAYIDSIFEAKKALVDNFGANMVVVAKDVKLQVEFNPETVKGYRLIGYENRVMAAEDFNDDTKDGGEMGAGHTVTVIYEIALTDSDMEISDIDLKYDSSSEKEPRIYNSDNDYSDELFTVSIRYKEPDKDKSRLLTYVCDNKCYSKKGSDNLRWAAAVSGFGMVLKDSEYKGKCNAVLVNELAKSCNYEDDEYKKEFIDLVDKYLESTVEICY